MDNDLKLPRRARRQLSRERADEIPFDPDLTRQLNRSESRKETWARLRNPHAPQKPYLPDLHY